MSSEVAEGTRRVVAIIGSRTWKDWGAVAVKVEEHIKAGDLVVTGCAQRGVDHIVRETCKAMGTHAKTFVAHWRSYGTKAGPMRNKLMADACDMMIAFRARGKSNGTDSAIYWARHFKKALTVVREEDVE